MSKRFDLTSLSRGLLPEAPAPSEGPLPVASVAVIINPEDRGGSVLLITRTERNGDPWSGQIGFPGGHKSSKDQGLLHTAIREAKEEVGIELARHAMLGAMPFVTTRSRRVQVAPFVFTLKSIVTVRPNREVAESFWVSLIDLIHLDVKKRKVHVDEGDLEVNSFDYDGRIIWGLTFRILNLLLNRTSEDHL